MAQRTRHPHHPNPTAEALEELEHLGDRISRLLAENPRPVLAVLGAVLLIAALAGGLHTWQGRRESTATTALEAARTAYLEAMGASPLAVEIPEPANPETGRRARSEFAERFAQVAEAHSGTAAGLLARLEAGDLRSQLGETEAALEAWRLAGSAADTDSALRALAFERIAEVEEQAGRFAEAAAAWTEAGEVDGYPLRHTALAHAARCWLEAGETEQARALHQRIQTEAPEVRLPEHVAARLRELDAAPSAPSSSPD